MRFVIGLALMLSCASSGAQQYKFDEPQQVQCTARPYCGQAGRSCKAVKQTYHGKTVTAAREATVRACALANKPDSCACVQQCREAVQCSKI